MKQDLVDIIKYYYTNKLSSNIQQQVTINQLLQFVVMSRGRPVLKEMKQAAPGTWQADKRDAQHQSEVDSDQSAVQQ